MIIDAPRDEHIGALYALWREAFGDTTDTIDLFYKTAFSPERCRCVFLDGAVASALYWFDSSCRSERCAYIYAVATLAAYRGRGLCRMLMEDTHEHLLSMGYAFAALVPADDGLFDYYGKLGYRTFCSMKTISCDAADESVNLRKADVREYAEARRALLPEGAILQEGESLGYLSTMAELYVGEGFALAGEIRGDILYGTELLGDVSLAPKIAAALGCLRGAFRVPFGDTPFAMYYPLANKENVPTYLGLAFD